ncbi:DUF1906 domain-containing protein [Actinomadura sp. NEAU-AAG7]|uniref:DUF1906 domain-containing protein n=1 Tax=Actinomadura sp. NEAU-AAG7 TaxID=2839640 RepID=UPI001BE41311|nr:DUF1906 domain-containing protein [Actinomadura sp. NEAU-AAG7]MBT2213459.1 DUF1906 domain-containing protein [Actinomadura sp. NEAU-AAG7]
MTTFGIDHAWGRPGVPALRAAGAKFVCRYLSHDASKNLTRGEAASLSAAGIAVVVVWETTANRALSGRSGGVADAREADRQAAACGMPDGRPIYFAVDWDASAAQQGTIHAYLDGAASVLGRDRVGMYAGYGPISRAFNADKVAYGWQTYAWSGGRWDKRAQLQQYSNDYRINGVGCDYNRSVVADYGQWRIGWTPATPAPPAEDDDMPEYVSLGMTKPAALKAGEATRLRFDQEYADTHQAHADGNFPAVLNGGGKGVQFIVTVDVTPGAVEWRLIEADPGAKYATSKTYSTHTGSATVVGWCSAKQHLYVEATARADTDASVYVKAHYWIR